jgi:hypothetical protein
MFYLSIVLLGLLTLTLPEYFRSEVIFFGFLATKSSSTLGRPCVIFVSGDADGVEGSHRSCVPGTPID